MGLVVPEGGRRWPGSDHRRRRSLQRLHAQVTVLREALGPIRAELLRLANIEAAGRLSLEEAQRVRTLRQESERLWLELQRLRDEFLRLQGET